MFSIHFVNLLQVGLLSISLLGVFLLLSYPRYQPVCFLLLIVATSSLLNLFEELNITREFYLVTPVFVVGIGPAMYLAIKGLTTCIKRIEYLHLLPMILALPFTHIPEVVIAFGTVWRIAYTFLALKIIMRFHYQMSCQRSDAIELSLNWLIYSLLFITFISAADLVRLNLQPYISVTNNKIGQTISTFFGLLFFTFLIKQLVHQKEGFLSLSHTQDKWPESLKNKPTQSNTQLNTLTDNDQFDNYKALFEGLSNMIIKNYWYRIPRLTLQQLSELSGLQTRDISRAINLGAQKNFNDYINQLRLDEIKTALITQPQKSILSLAMESGFNSKSTFNQLFKKSFSTTPAAYRKSNQV